MLKAIPAIFGLETMDRAEQYAAVGGSLGIIAAVASAFIAWRSFKATEKQAQLASDANKMARTANETARIANETTQRSVDDQLLMSRLARSSSLRIAEVSLSDISLATSNGDLAAVGWFSDDGEVFAVIRLTLINEGLGAAFKIKLTPISVEGQVLVPHHNFGWRMLNEGQTIFEAIEPYASKAVGTFLALQPGATTEFYLAVRKQAFRLAKNGYFLAASYQLQYEDGMGFHEKCFEFGSYLGVTNRGISEGKQVTCPYPRRVHNRPPSTSRIERLRRRKGKFPEGR